MSNTSASGGPLLPVTGPGISEPLEGQDLLRFLQQVVVGVTGLDGSYVRPRWQVEPPNIPDAGTAWAAVGVTNRPSPAFSVEEHDPTGDGSSIYIRHEELNVACSFYDLGSGGQADYYAALLRDGLNIAQNREVLSNAGMGLVEVTEPIAVPSLLKKRWLYRVDETVVIRREVRRIYPVLNILTASGSIAVPPSIVTPFNVEP